MKNESIVQALSELRAKNLSDEEYIEELVELWEDAQTSNRDLSTDELTRDRPHLATPLTRKIALLQRFSKRVQASVPGLPPAALAGSRYQTCQDGYVASGGLGDIFRVHDSTLDRDVALKRPQDRWQSQREVLQRLEREARLTAKLEHPGIVPTYEYGTDATGRPYYVMRLIQGTSLRDAIAALHHETAHPAPGDLGSQLRALVQRIVSVCNALAYAHSRGVIHRDVKPDNVMLGEFGETFLVDWGLAAELDAAKSPTHETNSDVTPEHSGTETRPGREMGTYGFMSPEQANGLWNEVGPASDIFSLGATLYSLLTNQPPYSGANKAEQARSGKYDAPQKIVPSVSPVLAAICCKAMSLRPADRYQTPLEMAADLERWLADEPISCFRDSRITTLFRWIRRHRVSTAAGIATVLVTSIALGVGTAVLSIKNEALGTANTALLKSREAETAKTKLAEKRATQLTTSNEILSSVFYSIDLKSHPVGDKPLVEEMSNALVRAAALLESGDAGDAVETWPLRNRLASCLVTLAAYDPAIEILTKSNEGLAKALGPDNSESIACQANLAEVYRLSGRVEKAVELIESSLARLTRTAGVDSPAVIEVQSVLLTCYWDQGRLQSAIAGLQDLLHRKQRIYGTDHHSTCLTANSLAVAYLDAGDYAQARTVFVDNLARQSRLLGFEHVDTLLTKANLAVACWRDARPEEAERLSREVYELSSRSLGPAHPSSYGSAHTLSRALSQLGRHEEAVELSREASSAVSQHLGPNDRKSLVILASCGECLINAGHVDEGIQMIRAAVDRVGNVHGWADTTTLTIQFQLARAFHTIGDPSQSVQTLESMLGSIRSSDKSDLHPFCAQAVDLLANTLDSLGKSSEATSQLETMHEFVSHNFPGSVAAGSVARNLGYRYVAAGNRSGAIEVLRTTHDMQVKSLGASHHQTLLTLLDLAGLLRASGELAESIAAFSNLLNQVTEDSGSAVSLKMQTLHGLGEAHLANRNIKDSISVLEQAKTLHSKHSPDGDPLALQLSADLGAIYRAAGRNDEAIQLLEKVYLHLKGDAEAQIQSVLTTMSNLGSSYFEAKRQKDAMAIFGAMMERLSASQFNCTGAVEFYANAVFCAEELGEFATAETWRREWIKRVEDVGQAQTPSWATEKSLLAMNLVKQQKWIDAEPVCREALLYREMALAQSDPAVRIWQVGNCRSLLGESLLGQGKSVDAGPLLDQGYAEMASGMHEIPEPARYQRVSECIERLIRWAEFVKDDSAVEKWNTELVRLRANLEYKL